MKLQRTVRLLDRPDIRIRLALGDLVRLGERASGDRGGHFLELVGVAEQHVGPVRLIREHVKRLEDVFEPLRKATHNDSVSCRRSAFGVRRSAFGVGRSAVGAHDTRISNCEPRTRPDHFSIGTFTRFPHSVHEPS